MTITCSAIRPFKQCGFSLIELLTILALLALMLVLVSPSLGDWQQNQAIRGRAEILQAAIQKARSEAITRNRPVSLWLVTSSADSSALLDNSCTLTNTNSAWVISVNNPSGSCASAPSATSTPLLVDALAGSAQVAVAAFQANSTSGANTIRFDAYGRVMPSMEGSGPIERIEIKAPRDMQDPNSSDQFRSLRLMVSSHGATRLCDPALPIASADPRRCFS